MQLTHLHLVDFRLFEEVSFEPAPTGTTVITGPNGTGKTSILEAIAFAGTQRSFRGAQRESLVRNGADQAIVRAELTRQGSPVLVEAALPLSRRSRVQVNRQPARSRRDLLSAVPVSVFSPEDLGLVQGGPGRRRDLLDDALGLVDPVAAPLVDEIERVVRQRTALLRQASGRASPEVVTSLDVWDQRLAASGTALASARESLTSRLEPFVTDAYDAFARRRNGGSRCGSTPVRVTLSYRRSWSGDLAEALAAARQVDLRRGTTGVGPHRDDLSLAIDGRQARDQASQGEQRSLALALRLGVHHLSGERSGTPPILLLDDVFSELDPWRSSALVAELPAGQAILTTASPLPFGVDVAASVDVTALGHPRPA